MKILLTLSLLTFIVAGRSYSQPAITDSLKITINPDSVYSKVDIKAQYPGGEDARKRFMRENLNGEVALKKGCPLGTYTAIVKCIIDTAGIFTEITPETNHGYGMEEEAIRIIKKFPLWIPAMKNGIKVKSSLRFPVTFKVYR